MNRWCEALGIEVPRVEAVKDHREANTYALLIVALLERGGPLTLVEAAERLVEAGVGPSERVLRSLQRCKPGRAPVYREGDRYHLDPHDDELDLWVFRLGLKGARVPQLSVVRPPPAPLPGPEVPLTLEELTEAWTDASLSDWSPQRIALAVLDAHREPMAPAKVVAFAQGLTRYNRLRVDAGAWFATRGSAIEVGPDGSWTVSPGGDGPVRGARKAVRKRIGVVRRQASRRMDPAVIKANGKAYERRRRAHAAELAAMPRGLLYGFPRSAPVAVALLDVGGRSIETFVGPEVASVRERLVGFEIIGAMEVRALLRSLGFAPGERRLAELGPPQKTKKLNKRGRTLKITTELLIQGSCGMSKPFGDEEKLASYLRGDQQARARRRLESSVKSLFALYEYGRLHGSVRLRWGFLDERIPAPWVHRDETTLYGFKRSALEAGRPLMVVAGSAPGWAEPWAREQRVWVEAAARGWGSVLRDEYGRVVDDGDVQLARLG